MIRSLWNAAAMFPTAIFANPWAGSMAMRREVILKSGLLDRWSTSIVDDGPVREAVESLALQTRFVPTLVMTNPESCTTAFSVAWIGRMVKWSRIFEAEFRNTLAHALVTAILLLGWAGLLLTQIFIGAAWWQTAGLFVASNLLLVAGWFVMRGSRVTGPGRTTENGLLARQLTVALLMAPVTMLVFVWGTFKAVFWNRYVWRGIIYDLDKNGQVRAATDQSRKSRSGIRPGEADSL